jgi:cellulose 1,4-beta-cellobiosidase
VGEAKNCHDANLWSDRYCPDAASCAKSCGPEDPDYSATDDVEAIGDGLALKLVALGPYSTNVGSRLYRLGDGEAASW